MTDLMAYAAELADLETGGLPPVEKWNPARAGEIDIVIRADGVWVHEGEPIARARLARLFSTILKREDGRYFLATPVEKLEIRVDDAPFVAVLMRTEGDGADRRLVFTTNMGDEIAAGPGHAIVYRESPAGGDRAPYIHVRADLWARISRAVFYDLVALGETRERNGEEVFGIASAGEFFPLGSAEELTQEE